MQYFYRVAMTGPNGKYTATLNKGDDKAIKKIGTYNTEAAAQLACKEHYGKAVATAINFGRNPPAMYMV